MSLKAMANRRFELLTSAVRWSLDDPLRYAALYRRCSMEKLATARLLTISMDIRHYLINRNQTNDTLSWQSEEEATYWKAELEVHRQDAT